MDRERLAQLLEQAGSNNDEEALRAIRRATAMVRSEGLTWRNLLVSRAPTTKLQVTPDVQHIFDSLTMCLLKEKDAEFVSSVKDFWEKRGTVSARQLEVLQEILTRYRG